MTSRRLRLFLPAFFSGEAAVLLLLLLVSGGCGRESDNDTFFKYERRDCRRAVDLMGCEVAVGDVVEVELILAEVCSNLTQLLSL